MLDDGFFETTNIFARRSLKKEKKYPAILKLKSLKFVVASLHTKKLKKITGWNPVSFFPNHMGNRPYDGVCLPINRNWKFLLTNQKKKNIDF